MEESKETHSADLLARQVEAAHRDMEAFAYSVSHDLSAPIRHIRGYSDMLGKELAGALDAKCAEYLGGIAQSVERLESSLAEMLDFSRLSRAEMRFVSLDLGDLARHCIRKLQPAEGEREIIWEVGDLPRIWADRSLLESAMMQLLGNALKFTRLRAVAHISILSESGADGRPAVAIRDNGAGFNPRYAAKLFKLFQRLHKQSDFPGWGTGLAKARCIIQRHGGWITAEGEIDKGACFRFHLPKQGEWAL